MNERAVGLRPRVAVVDDEPRMAEILAMVLRSGDDPPEVTTFTAPAELLAALERAPFDLLLTDLRMPRIDGLTLARRARALCPSLEVVLITAHASVETAVAAMKDGALDYLTKPVDNAECRRVVARALERGRLARENRQLRAELRHRHGLDAIVAVSDGMTAALELARRAAQSRSTVLIEGESGTGKELVARAIHLHSDRVGQPFVAVNCKAFAAGVLESELFGHVKGAFTGAARDRRGVFEQAGGGTLLLDEIGEVSLEFQARLLRVLQEREVTPVGAERARHVDVRIVAATNRSLRDEVAAGRFREDLYFRLAVIPIRIPPLRERRDDILPLARGFLARMNEEQGRSLPGWSPEVERWLLTHDWPGNVRELENTLERGVVLARGELIERSDVILPEPSGVAPGGPRRTLQAHLDEAARARVEEALREAGGVRVDAARALGVERTTLYRLMKRFEID
ncbi:MAG: sigma-54 dependent transcriptional regulator [Nannocystaceae bacterium]